MRRMLKQLQKKPERVREQIALFGAGGLTIIIIAIWALSLSNPFKSDVVATEAGVEPEKPFQLFFSSVSDGLKEQRQSLKENNPMMQHDETLPYSETETQTETTMTSEGMPIETSAETQTEAETASAELPEPSTVE